MSIKTKKILLVILSLILTIGILGCTTEEVTEENTPDIMSAYSGWWTASVPPGGTLDAPFYAVKLSANNGGEIYCYDSNGNQVATGMLDHSDNSELSEEHPLVFILGNGEEYAVAYEDTDSLGRHIVITPGYNSYRYDYLAEESDFEMKVSEPYENNLLGYWLGTPNDDIPFTAIDVTSGDILLYDEEGNVVGSGYYDYNEQRGLNGNPPFVFYFDSDVYGGSIGNFSDGSSNITLTPIDEWATGSDSTYTFDKQDDSPYANENQ